MATMTAASVAGQQLLFDSNIVIFYLRDELDVATTELLESALDNNFAAISVVTRAEVLAWSNHTSESLTLAEELLAAFLNIPVDEKIANGAAQIRRSVNIKLPDALIAATALDAQRTLVTANVRDFEKIADLGLVAV
jgi:predicted nucleic acid-binding protein